METIALKVTTKNGQTTVKDGRKTEATISHGSEGYMVVRAGMAFYRDSMEAALEFVRSNREDRANVFGGNRKVSIT
jgi:hypothetical protein